MICETPHLEDDALKMKKIIKNAGKYNSGCRLLSTESTIRFSAQGIKRLADFAPIKVRTAQITWLLKCHR
jgi:hypothetical protein